MSAALHRDSPSNPLTNLSRGWSAIETRVATRRAVAHDRRFQALDGLGHLPED